MHQQRNFTADSIREGIARNEERECSLRGCIRLRVKLSAPCGTHLRRRHRWGSPEQGRRFLVRGLLPREDVARDFLQVNRNHRAVAAAVDWFNGRLHSAYKHTGT
jgi:hypothetical protein